MTGIQLLDGSAAHQFRVVPYTPKCNVWLAQRLEIESMNTLRRRMQRHTLQVLMQQTDNLGAAQVIYADVHMNSSLMLWALTWKLSRLPRVLRPAGRIASVVRRRSSKSCHLPTHSAMLTPEPPISFGTSFIFGNPSFMRSFVS